ncbi:sulfur oxidation c-type cytochrome SoxA [Pseudooceanicola sp.]|uniref:sulfur oxidation c-type cytochrome SoxA n=1 Tax=Pseudooceanicola sp. TaxID=1914328 RepID=UPI004059C256
MKKTGLLMTAVALVASGVWAQDDNQLVINGEIEIITDAPAPEYISGLDTIYSGWRFRQPAMQQLEMDDFENPASLAIDDAAEQWSMVEGSEGKSCASCHEDLEDSMAGVRAVYPKWNEGAGEVRTLANQINTCRTENMGAEAWKYDGTQMTGAEALIGMQSRGMPVNVAVDGPAHETWKKGEEMYYTRYGQLELSCASCHEENYDNYIRADHLSQGQINGFPAFRLKQNRLIQTHNRFKGCIRDTRAETFSPGSPEFVALELYVASRGNGLSVEAPSVRP